MMSMLMLSGFFMGFAQSTNQPDTGTTGRLDKVTTPTKHKAPSNVFIEYAYVSNGFYFMPSGIFESLNVTVTNLLTMESWEGQLSEANGYWLETGALSVGTYTISAITDGGVEFCGEFNLND